MDKNHFDKIKMKYGFWSSWAIWSDEDVSDLTIIERNLSDLRPDIVMAALNISRKIDTENKNFHFGRNDVKLSRAINHSSYRGSYLTDIIKGFVEGNSFKLKKGLTPEIEAKHVKTFNEELIDLQSEIKLIIAIGNEAFRILTSHLGQKYEIVQITHYSYRFQGCSDPVEYARRVNKELSKVRSHLTSRSS